MTQPHDNTKIMAIVSLAVLVLIGLIYYDETVLKPEAYRAWIKLTGNPKSLSFKEWRALQHHEETILYIPIYYP